MQIKKGTRKKVDGPIKGFLNGFGGILVIFAIIGLFSNLLGGLIIGTVGIIMLLIANNIESKTQITY